MLDFLSTATIVDVAEHTASARKNGGPRKERIPGGMAIRLFRDGSIYPSNELVMKFNLEYPKAQLKSSEPIPPKPGDTEIRYKNSYEVSGNPGNGFDIIDTEQYRAFKVDKRILLISPVSRKAGKVDLFAGTAYDEDGSPKSSVTTQGAKTYGKEDLLPLVKEVYGIDLTKKDGDDSAPDYVDLVLVANPSTGKPWEGKAVTYIPKKLSRGKDAGTYSTQRRENPVFYALLPVSLVESSPNSGDSESVKAEPVKMVEEAVSDNPFS